MKGFVKFFADPVRGATSLWKVVWLYSVVGGAVLSLIGLALLPLGADVALVFSLICLCYGAYVTVATFQCALNCPWPPLGRLLRACCFLSLLAIPYFTYLILVGGLRFST